MEERVKIADLIRDLLAKHEVSVNEAAKWAGIAQSTFSMKLKGNTFSAEEARAIIEGLGIEIKLIEEGLPLKKQFGGVGPKVRLMVNRKIYDTSKSVALCHSEWADGWRMELFVDADGCFFVVHYTKWENAQDFISEIGKHDAAMMYAKHGDGTQNDLFK